LDVIIITNMNKNYTNNFNNFLQVILDTGKKPVKKTKNPLLKELKQDHIKGEIIEDMKLEYEKEIKMERIQK